ncbi:gamma-aminobutyric acid type B receptor subunit 2-like isoform X2 [Nilaparvata lugens]|uniref:gamma-aminobutyric acid type B receptor subunit 2-like isoform X2 n=1 Tax=Nilaparvata lugens TaxID=108931 RepID=UPI00193CFC64|nr:gamma-aminobutyric acid type B receptor subunit 2-like isoform X2 [Nilaparvata lugens]
MSDRGVGVRWLVVMWGLWWGIEGVGSQRPTGLNKRHDVYIAGFFPFGRHVPESSTGRGVMPAVKLAVDHINESPAVLRNYRLHMWWNDTECNAAVGVKAFFDMMHDGPHKVMLFGASCTQVTDPIAKASKHWRLTQLSYADTHPMFTPLQFPNFFRVVPSENAFNLPRLKLMTYFNWTRVGTIYQNEPRYSLAHNRLVADLDQFDFSVVESQSFANEVKTAIKKLKDKDVRIILGNFNESWARHIFCEAHNQGMVGRKYQWLIMGTYGEKWWSEEAPCDTTELTAALEGCILTDLLPLATTGDVTVSGFTAEEYQVEYDSRRGQEYSRFHGYTYDGIWAVALAIQHVAHRIRHFHKNQTVVDFQYRSPLWERLFLEALRNTSFEGVTGPVRFYENERKASIMLKQFLNGAEVKIGEFNGVTRKLDLTRGQGIRWKDGRGPPKDRTLQQEVQSHVNIAIYSLLAATASLGIIMAAVFLAINIKYRNQRYIKMSSPHLNNLIIIGCMLTYSSVIFLGLDSSLTSVAAFPYICTARAWLLMAGFSLAFGAMFSKTWRVHSIFTDVKLNKKVIKDYQLFMVVGVLLAIDLGIMTTWQVTDPFYRDTKQMEPYPHPHSEDIIIIPKNEYCQSNRMTIFVGSIYAYKGLLMIFGAFLAWETRHVSIPALNDSKYVGMSVYNVVLMCIMGAAISFVLSDQQDASFIIISIFILFCTTATLCLVFVPKIVELRRNPQGQIDKRIRATLRPMSKTRRDSSELEEQLRDAKNTNQRCRKMLLERDAELQALLRRLGSEERLDKLTAPPPHQDVVQLRKEPPSQTETTDVTSLCSLNSNSQEGEYVNLQTMDGPPPSKKKTSFAGSKQQHASQLAMDDGMPPQGLAVISESSPNGIMPIGMGHGTSGIMPIGMGHGNAANGIMPIGIGHSHGSGSSIRASPPIGLGSKAVSWEEQQQLQPRQLQSHCGGGSATFRRRSSAAAAAARPPPQAATPPAPRRTSVPGRRPHPTYVHQDELWLTQRSSSSSHCRPRCLLNNSSPPDGSDEEVSVIQRSVSERSRDKCCGHNRPLKKPTPAHVQSTPNVLAGAVSEGELLDLAILPIFQKLLTERRGAAIASCPNIAIKCDIVEYL